MGMERFLLALTLVVYVFFSQQVSLASRIRIKNNGYQDILIALPPKAVPRDRPRLVSNLKNIIQHSSEIFSASSKGRAVFRSITFLVPPEWGVSWDASFDFLNNSTAFGEADAAITREDADIVVTYDGINDHPYTLHHETCGHQGVRIYLPANFLLSRKTQETSVEFLRLWSEFRYGIFPEGGFENDRKYPNTYKTPGDVEDKVTGCAGQNFGVPYCGQKTQCLEEFFTSSLMDQHLETSATFFCEGEFSLGPAHNPHSPSKHNLLCKEEGTWFTFLRSQDFADGRNSAPKYAQDTEVSFNFVQEVLSSNVIVIVETSSKMSVQSRFSLIKNAFSRLVYSTLVDGSELTLLNFSGYEVELIRSPTVIEGEINRIKYLEGQPLPEDTTQEEFACIDCSLDYIFEIMNGNATNFSHSPVIILVTAQSNINSTRYPELREKILESNILLHVLSFQDNGDLSDGNSLFSLSTETNGHFIHIGTNILRDLYNGFDSALHSRKKNIMIAQEYLSREDGETLTMSFQVENRVFEKIRVYISGIDFENNPLIFDQTTLDDSNGVLFGLRKQEILSAWTIDVASPQAGVFTLSTKRKDGATSPVLISVSGSPSYLEDPIVTRVWAETLNEVKISPPPVRIFAEVRKGSYPIAGALVSAQIQHPGGELSELILIDDGLGNVDVTKDDGIYSRFYTNFTVSGWYNVYINATIGFSKSETVIVTGPDGYCCGTVFNGSSHRESENFQRIVGPFSFYVTSIPDMDIYPPSRVTDLILQDIYDQIYVLKWTAVGSDYDAGVASEYELKVFPDRSAIRHRFSGSNLELYKEIISTTSLAEYGKQLVHTVMMPKLPKKGIYYFAIRAIDSAGNVGEPSNALPVWIEHVKTTNSTDCLPEETPQPEKWNAASSVLPVVSLILWMCILSHL